MSRAFSSGRWPLLVALAIGLALRLYVGLTHPIDYNGFWHVFIARNLSREFHGLAHPPFFLLLLKAVDAVSHSRLAYLSISILSGLGAVALVHRILEKLRTSRAVAFLGALTMATAPSAIFLSCAVQSYMLAVFFILWSFVYSLDVFRPEPAGWRSRAAFAVLASLAVLSEYFAGLYVVACAFAPILIAAFRPASRGALRRALPRRILPDIATLGPPSVVGVFLYELVAKPWVTKLNHLPEFYFTASSETAAAFLTRNLWNIFNLFSPVVLWSPRRAAALVLGFVAVVFFAAVTERRREPGGEDRAMPSAILAILLALGIALGFAGLYPFGGASRQQFLYFLFAVLAGSVAFDRLVRAAASPPARRLLLVLGGAAIAANLGGHAEDLQPPGRDPFTRQARAFDRAVPGARVVQTDQFNLIGYFIAHHDWAWSFRGTLPGLPAVQRYELERDGRRLTLLAHRDHWNFDAAEPGTYAALRAGAAAAGAPCASVFDVHQNLYKPMERKLPHLDAEVVEPRARELAAAEGLDVRRLVVRGDDVFMDLCAAGAAPRP